MKTREIDWRFVLPSPSGSAFDHLILLGGSTEMERAILDLGLARAVSTTLPSRGSADAVIGLAGTCASLADAVRELDENGVLYWEVDRRSAASFALTPSRVTRQLARLGLTLTASYWVSRSFSQRLMYLPLQCEGALTWYLQTLCRTPTFVRRLARRALVTAADWLGLSAIAPCYAVTAVRGGHAAAAIVAKAAAEGVAIPAEAHAVFLAHGSTEWNRIVVLVFRPGERTPAAVLKLPRTATFNRDIEWEHDVLSTLAPNLPPEISGSIPRSHLFRWNDLAVSAQTCVAGSSLNSRARPAEAEALNDLHRVVEWLTAFHRHTTEARVPAKPWARQHFSRARREYTDTFGLTDAEARLFDGVMQQIDRLGAETLPFVWQHADLGPPNLYLDDQHVAVIDWETARRGPALQDLLYLVGDWTAAIRGQTRDLDNLDNFRLLYGRPTHHRTFFNAVRHEIADYMRHVGVAPSLFHVLLIATFVDKALERARRLSVLGSPFAASRDGNRFVACVEILASHVSADSAMAVTVAAADVTVAIATMNRPAALSRCVKAILASPTRPGELIIVDQSDNNDTANLIARSGWRGVVSLTYLKQTQSGLAVSRNTAISHSSRPVMAFTDDDCVPREGWLEALLAAFNSREQPDAVTGRILPLGPEQPGRYAVSTRASRVRTRYRARAYPWSVGSGGNAAVKRQWLQRIGGFDERLGAGSPGRSAEDMDLFYRLLQRGATVVYEPNAVVYHERKDRQQRLDTRPAYGFGMGAFCALAARHRDAYALWMLARWSYERLRALLAGFARGRWTRVVEESLMLRGAADGFARTLTRNR